jgi:hypothetical protein
MFRGFFCVCEYCGIEIVSRSVFAGAGVHLAVLQGEAMSELASVIWEQPAVAFSRKFMRSGDGMMKPWSLLLRIAVASALLMGSSNAQQPSRTTVSDIVYRADGSPASGTVLISWPEFTTADSKPVAAGR